LFLFAGSCHFIYPAAFDRAMPDWIPAHYSLVLFTGVCEILGAIGLLLRRFRQLSARSLALFLLAVFPVNIHMAINSQLYPAVAPGWLWVRLPLQFILIAAILWSTATGSYEADRANRR
jgi:uncharacterized membrane protein